MRNKIKLFSLLLFVAVILGVRDVYSQADNFITQYDPYIIQLKNLEFYNPTNDPIDKNSNMILIIQGNIGTQKNAFIKFLTVDQLAFESAREYDRGYIQTLSVLNKKGVLVPPLKDIQGTNFLELTVSAYTDLSETDYDKIYSISGAGLLPVATAYRDPFIGIYKNYPQPTETLEPTDERWAEAEAFLAGMNTRKKIDLGSVTLNVPMVIDVRNISVGDNLVTGDKVIAEERGSTIATVNFRDLKDELIVYEQDYYKELYRMFLKHAATPSNLSMLTADMIELNDFKANGFRDRDDVYINPEAKKQLGHILEVLISAVPIKNDTVETTSATMPIELQVALDYFRTNLVQEQNRFNKYIFQTYIADETNMAKLKRETDRIRKYYNYMN